jgi:hypothetical protein
MTNGNGGAYNLVSFLGINNLCTLTPPLVKANILDPCLQDGPVLLKASNFNLQNANTDSTDISLDIEQKILKLAWHQICTSIFAEICPGYSSQPHAALDHIKQSYVDGDGNMVSTPVCTYYQRMMNGMQPFAGEARFPVSVCNILMDGLNSRLVSIFRCNYKDYAIMHNLQASYQRSKFPKILQAMQMSEDEVKSITAIARSPEGGQAFHADAMAFPSQADNTLNRYLGGNGCYKSDGGSSAGGYCLDDTTQSLGGGDTCFGCKGNHPWMHDGKVLCPNKDKPGIQAKAEAAYQKWRTAMKARHGKEGRGKKRKVDYDRMSPANKEHVKESVLASMGINPPAETPDKPSSDPASTSKKPLIFMIDVPVLSMPALSCNILPALIVSNFPHIHLLLGSTLDCPDCPIL